MSRIYSFPPVIDERARVLIAGTAPSVKSLEHGQFYGHPQNYFWRVVYALFQDGAEKREGASPDTDYGKRIAFIHRHRLALWDVISSCQREGSLDANIKGEIPNDFPTLLQQYPGIRAIAFNGSKAFDTFRKAYGNHPSVQHIAKLKLPSTSPIPSKHMRNLDDRIRAWQVIVPFTID